MNKPLKEHIKIFLDAHKAIRPAEIEISKFARKTFNERFSEEENTWYKRFDVVDEDHIRICYGYRGGDQEMSDSFIVKIP